LAGQGVPVPAEGEDDVGPGPKARRLLAEVRQTLEDKDSLAAIAPDERWPYRTRLLRLRQSLKAWEEETGRTVPPHLLRDLAATTEYIPTWVVIGVAVALGIGTMVGWKRIVITVG